MRERRSDRHGAERPCRHPGSGRAAFVAALVFVLIQAGSPAGRAQADTLLEPQAAQSVEQNLRGVTITGAGSSFAAPVYQGWSLPVQRDLGIGVNYQAIGSSAGQDQVIAGTVDFGASDKPMATAQLQATHLYQFPTVMSGVVVIVNLPRTGSAPAGSGTPATPPPLRLDGPVLADIYGGVITRWNDPRIRRLNPGLVLPDELIAAVHRADGSGTTYVFTSYLSLVSPQWRQRFGAGTLVGWTGGDGARGNDGVAAIVRQVPWSIGYVEYAYAAQNRLDMVALKNRAGNYVLPTLAGFASAVASADWKIGPGLNGAVDLLDRPGAVTWPIVTPTYALVPARQSATRTGHGVRAFFNWGLTQGGAVTERLGYVGLPADVQARILAGWPR
ncbi:phosphate ABC transporter substrate-binding protein PstS [Oecophyllibacter saccharovorans]|uniref:Phosphate-binding protein PstS n=1 Tax=Oecophyllibacter saccharovorans TaxID=2558360 RepID=A0A506UL04_9PROT|nr:phosphate ABC transporter substrate-binding protein PstS [Oecophyllibacter saccharovorans]